MRWTSQVSGKAESNRTSHRFRASKMALELARDTGMGSLSPVQARRLPPKVAPAFTWKTKTDILAHGSRRCRLFRPSGGGCAGQRHSQPGKHPVTGGELSHYSRSCCVSCSKSASRIHFL